MVVATAVNGRFVRLADRPATPLKEGDKIEILAPMQGG
jgi:sulfur carrier protein